MMKYILAGHFFLRMVTDCVGEMTKAFKDLCIFVSNYLEIILTAYDNLCFYVSEKMSSSKFYY